MKNVELPPFDHQPQPYNGPSAEEVLALRKEFLNPAIFHYYKKPLMIVEGKAQYLFDEKGRRYLDGFGGIVTVSVGHCHPHVRRRGADAERTRSSTRRRSICIRTSRSTRQALAAKMPGDLKVCYFVNSGSEANDLALLMARAYTGNYDVIALRNGYHGGNASRHGADRRIRRGNSTCRTASACITRIAPILIAASTATTIPTPDASMPTT